MKIIASINKIFRDVRQSGQYFMARREISDREFIDENATKIPMLKSQLLGMTFLAGFLILGARVSYLTLFRPVDLARSSAKADTEKTAPRADIVDRNGALLATSLLSYSLYADPAKIWDPRETAEALLTVFPELDEQELIKKLSSARRFVWIKRRLTPREKDAVWALAQPGLEFENENRRVYPMGNVAGHILGGINSEGEGVSGLERGLQALLNSKHDGPVKLSIDSRVQYILERELSEAAVKYSAANGVAAIMDVRSGEILGASSWPFINPNDYSANSPYARQNRLVNAVYEMGSTFKAFTFAAAFNDGKITADSQFDASRPIKIGNHSISDLHGENRVLTAREILSHSSNIGTALISRVVGSNRLVEFFGNLGLLKKVSGEFSGVASPLLPKRWGATQTATASFGHGIAVSPLAVLAGFGAITNGGVYIKPTFLARSTDYTAQGTRIMSPEASAQTLTLLRDVVVKGTGQSADAEFYPVAGKTGTAEKAIKGGYDSNRRLSSFAGVFPANQPQYAILFLLDEPKGIGGGAATAAIVTAPSVSKIISRVAPILGVTPARPVISADNIGANAINAPKSAVLPPKVIANKTTPNIAIGAR